MTRRKLGWSALLPLVLSVNVHADPLYTLHVDLATGIASLGAIKTNTATGAVIGPYGLPAPILDPADPNAPTYTFAISGAFDNDRTLYTILQTLGDTPEESSSQLGTVNVHTGEATPFGSKIETNLVAMEIDDQGTIWATGFTEFPLASTPSVGFFGDTKLYRGDKRTGIFSEVGDTGVERFMDLAFDSSGTLWGTVGNKLWTIDTNTGQATPQPDIIGVTEAIPESELLPFQHYAEIMGIAFDANDTLYGSTFTVNSGLFTIDTTTGAATLEGRTGIDLAHGGDILLPPPTAIYTSHGIHTRLGTIDSATGTVADIGPYALADSFQASAAFDLDSTLYTVAVFDFGGDNPHTQLATVDTTTGTATLVGSPMDAFVLPLEVDSSNTMYTMRFVAPEFGLGGEPTLFTVDSASGQLTAIGNTEVTRAMDLAFSSDGTLWVVGGAEGGNRLYTIDPVTGASTFQTEITGVVEAAGVEGAEIMGIMFDENDNLLATSFFGGSSDYVSPLFAIDTSTGVATVIGDSGLVNPHGGDTLLPPPRLQAGDADQNLQFDQFDLVQVLKAAKYLTGEAATWGEGDWNGAPGGRAGNPPVGNGLFDEQDIVAALQNGLYETGGYAALKANGGDLIYVPEPASALLLVVGLTIGLGYVRRPDR